MISAVSVGQTSRQSTRLRPSRALSRLRPLLGVLMLGCWAADATGPSKFGPVATKAITESLEDSLAPDGYFSPQVLADEPGATMTPEAARRLANAYFRTFASGRLASWSVHRGAQIAPSIFRACGPTLAADGAYSFDSPPDEHLSRAVSGRYLIHACNSAGEVIALLSISAQGVADTTTDGYLKAGSIASNTFFSYGVPIAHTNGMILSAERAAELAFALSGERVAAVPRLVSSLHPDAPHFARWEIRLEDSVTASGIHSAATVTTVDVLIGFDESLYIVSSHRMLRAVSRATVLDAADSLPAHDFVGDTLYWVPVHVRPGRARGVEPIVRAP